MQQTILANQVLLDQFYSVIFKDFNRNTVFDSVRKYQSDPTTANLKLAIVAILTWGAYYESRRRHLTEIVLVEQNITDDYAARFYQLFASQIASITPKQAYELFDKRGALKIKGIRHAYLTKILYFFSSREKGLLILDKWLVLNSMKLAIDYQDEYAIKWYYKLTPHSDKDSYNYNGVCADSYQDYIDFMQRAKTKVRLEYADQLETLLFGWDPSNPSNKKFAIYDNPREVAFGDPFFIPAPSSISRVSNSRQQAITKSPKAIVSVANNLELLTQFIAMRPSGTVNFALALGYKKDSPEYVKTYTTMNKILRSVQGGASCRTFFNETLPSIRNGSTKIINQYSEYIAQL